MCKFDHVNDLGRFKGSGKFGASAAGVQRSGDTKAAAQTAAINAALHTLVKFDASIPTLVGHAGMVSMIFPRMDCSGTLYWCYSNPREPSELPAGELGGWSCGYKTQADALSAALFHMCQNDLGADLPAVGLSEYHRAEITHYRQLVARQSAAA